MFNEYFTPPSIVVSPVQEAAALRSVVLADSPISSSIDQDDPSSKSTSQGSSSNVRQTHTPFEYLGKWTKDHPIENVMTDEFGGVLKNKARLVAQGFRQEEGIDSRFICNRLPRIEAIYKLRSQFHPKNMNYLQMDSDGFPKWRAKRIGSMFLNQKDLLRQENPFAWCTSSKRAPTSQVQTAPPSEYKKPKCQLIESKAKRSSKSLRTIPFQTLVEHHQVHKLLSRVLRNIIVIFARTFRVILFSIHNDEWKSFQCHHQTALRSVINELTSGEIVSLNFIESIKEVRSRVQDLTSGEIVSLNCIESIKEVRSRVQDLTSGEIVSLNLLSRTRKLGHSTMELRSLIS
ncbi:hypothetical protein Tco_0965753 [Tanacetum coccineum]